MSGRLIAVVGPSGVGKDSLIAGLVADDPRLSAVRRVVTRDAEAGGEPCDCVDRTEFERRAAAGAFALAWQAHGLSYGIPRLALAPLERGQDLLVNLSRAVLPDAAGIAPGFLVMAVTASPEVLAARLAARGRETEAQIAARITRQAAPIPETLARIVVDNSGPLEQTIAKARAALYPGGSTR